MLDFDRYEYLTFDCYGTLIDWERGILTAIHPILASHGVSISDDELLERYGDLESAAEQGEYHSYKETLATVLDGFAKHYGFALAPGERESLAASVGDWPPFADTVEALGVLASRYKLVILSNIDDDLFALSAKHLRVQFAAVITAQQVGSYKPNLGHFRVALERLGGKEHILHVAQSLFHDIVPAKEVGLATVWVNRRHDRPGFGATPPAEARPDLEVPDLRTLAGMVGRKA
jgi:2-haloacid dehalogenase